MLRFFLAVLFFVTCATSSFAQQYRITDSSCIGWFRPPGAQQDIPGSTVRAQVPDWRPYLDPQLYNALLNQILREMVPKCIQGGSRPLVFNIRISAQNVSYPIMFHTRFYTDGKRFELVENNIPTIQRAEISQQNKAREDQNAAAAAAQAKAKAEEHAETIRKQKADIAAEQSAKAEQAANALYNLQIKKAEEMHKSAEEAAAARAKSHPADAFCMFSCDPKEEHARAVLKNKMNRIIRTPVIVSNFVKKDGIKMTVAGLTIYELRYTADLDLPLGFGARPKDFNDDWDKQQTASYALMTMNTEMGLVEKFKGRAYWQPAAYTAAGLLRFVKVDRGWQGADDVVYK